MPERVQRRRTAGWRAPEDAVYVGRGSRWGNPWKVGSTGWTVLPGGWIDRRPHDPLTREQAVDSFRNAHTHDVEYLRDIREQLAGRDLMCWCRLDQVCHADWLLEVATAPARWRSSWTTPLILLRCPATALRSLAMAVPGLPEALRHRAKPGDNVTNPQPLETPCPTPSC